MSSEFTWRAAVELLECLIEPPDAAKAAGQCDLDHGKVRLMDQLLGKQHATRLCDSYRGRSDVLAKEPAKMPLTDFKSIGQRFDIRIVEGSALNEFQGP
jgi:hypothetical protein